MFCMAYHDDLCTWVRDVSEKGLQSSFNVGVTQINSLTITESTSECCPYVISSQYNLGRHSVYFRENFSTTFRDRFDWPPLKSASNSCPIKKIRNLT